MNSMFALGEASIALIWMVIMVLFYGFVCMVGIAGYVLSSWGMYSISKRRGISKPWLAWLPIGCDWILGCISDQYQLAAKGKNKSKRKILLGLNLAMLPATVLYLVAYVMFMVGAMGPVFDASAASNMTAEVLLALVFTLMVASGLLLTVLAVIYIVFMYMALFDLFQSCNPETGVLFLVLSIVLIFVASIELSPLFVFLDRKKDLGMPVADDGFELPEAAE